MYWASHLTSLTGSNLDESSIGGGVDDVAAHEEVNSDRLLLAEMLVQDGQSHRAAQLLRRWGMEKDSLRACHLCAKALVKTSQLEEALEVLDGGVQLINDGHKVLQDQEQEEEEQDKIRKAISSIYLLKGQVLERMDNRDLASESFREALRIDAFCAEALRSLTSHQMLTAPEERAFVEEELSLSEQCAGVAGLESMVSFLYRSSLKKYSRPDDAMSAPDLTEEADVSQAELEACAHARVQRAEACFYNCDFENCLKLTTA